MRLTLTIDCDNAAFEDDPAGEVARILHRAAELVERRGLTGADDAALLDINRNAVGCITVEGAP